MSAVTVIPTWDDLIACELRLAALLVEMQAVTDDPAKPTFCANDHWYGYGNRGQGFRRRMVSLVGNSRKPEPVLGTEAAYEVAYDTLYAVLPDCRNCQCL
ncbi:MAG: hypothetical protein QM692_21270 [Thermomicrobiales bacterium]